MNKPLVENASLPVNPLNDALRAGQLGLAAIIKQVQSPNIATVFKAGGYEAIYIDLEYGVIPERASPPMLSGAREAGLTPLIRIPSADPACATRCLNAGALGVVVPKIKTLDQVKAMVKVAKCAPIGERAIDESWFRGQDLSDDEKRALMNSLTTLIIMLESPEALALAEDIAKMPGVDVLHIGTFDLSESLGVPHGFDEPRIEQAYTRVIEICRKYGKTPGGGGLGTDQAATRKYIQKGVRFITAGNEWAFMTAAAKERAAALHGIPLAQGASI